MARESVVTLLDPLALLYLSDRDCAEHFDCGLRSVAPRAAWVP